MPEYIYLLEHRLSTAQKHALAQVRDAAREAGMTVFLTGGAVRDLTTGSSVRNFNFSVQGNALDLQAALVARGAEVWGTHEPTRTLTLWFPGSVRADVASTRSEEYPKPGKPVYHWSTIVEDLRRRDFTANAMALSLNEGSYGLLLDPLNGIADIEARLLRIASNYGFIEDPSRLVRATRLQKRLGWQVEERTATRYANAKEAESIKAISPYLRGYELEKIASEEDALDVLKSLEAEGWMEHLFAAWTSAKADLAGLDSLRRNWIQLLMQGVIADLTVAHLELLTSGMDAKEIDALKKTTVHPGLVRHWEALDESAKEFGKLLSGKAAATPSATWKLLTTHAAEPILWLAHTRKAGAVDTKFKNFFTVWPEFKKRVPAAMMLEMRITPELPAYAELLEQLFFQLIDGNLETDEQMRAFLEPWSPPAPPPPPTVRRSRAKKSESKTKRRISAPDEDEEEGSDDEEDEDVEDAEDADEEEEIVEDDALSKVLDKLHADEDPEDAEIEGDADEIPNADLPIDEIDDLPGKALDDEDRLGDELPSKDVEAEDDLPVQSAAPRAQAGKAAAAAVNAQAHSADGGSVSGSAKSQTLRAAAHRDTQPKSSPDSTAQPMAEKRKVTLSKSDRDAPVEKIGAPPVKKALLTEAELKGKASSAQPSIPAKKGAAPEKLPAAASVPVKAVSLKEVSAKPLTGKAEPHAAAASKTPAAHATATKKIKPQPAKSAKPRAKPGKPVKKH